MLKNIAFLMEPIDLGNFNRQAWNLEQLIKGLGLIEVQVVRSQQPTLHAMTGQLFKDWL